MFFRAEDNFFFPFPRPCQTNVRTELSCTYVVFPLLFLLERVISKYSFLGFFKENNFFPPRMLISKKPPKSKPVWHYLPWLLVVWLVVLFLLHEIEKKRNIIPKIETIPLFGAERAAHLCHNWKLSCSPPAVIYYTVSCPTDRRTDFFLSMEKLNLEREKIDKQDDPGWMDRPSLA